jgi:hypothetical protein
VLMYHKLSVNGRKCNWSMAYMSRVQYPLTIRYGLGLLMNPTLNFSHLGRLGLARYIRAHNSCNNNVNGWNWPLMLGALC